MFKNLNGENLPWLTSLEDQVDEEKRELIASHFVRLAHGNCNVDVSPYYSSVVLRLKRVADHLVNVGYSILNLTGSQKEQYLLMGTALFTSHLFFAASLPNI